MIAIDPGVRGCGYARFNTSTLSHAAYVRNPATSNTYAACRMMAAEVRSWGGTDIVVIEKPRIYPGPSRDKAGNMRDLNDLIDLACVAGGIAALFDTQQIITVYPADWKGQMPKEKMNKRVLETLTPEERECIESVGKLDHNTLDAIGIGLHYLGRLNKRVIHNE